jgi:hypothetical protein
LPPVFTNSDGIALSTFTIDAFMTAVPFLARGFSSSDRTISEFTLAWTANPLWTAAGVVFSWVTTAWAFSDEVNLWTKLFVALTFRPAAVGVILVNLWFKRMVLWAAVWGGWNVSDRAAVFAVSFAAWAFVFITAAVVGLFDKDSSDISAVTFTGLFSWAGLANVIEFLQFVASFTFPGPAWFVKSIVNLEFLDCLAFIVLDFADTFEAWDWGLFKLVVPAVVPGAVSPIFIGLTWLKDSITEFTSTFFKLDTGVEVRKNLTGSALSWFFVLAQINAIVG